MLDQDSPGEKLSMAQRGRPIPDHLQRQIVRMVGAVSVRRAAREIGVSPTTVQKYSRKSRFQFGTASR
jgi:transposase-like protein